MFQEDCPMPTYITLYKFTDQGIRSIKEIPQRIEEAIKNFEQMGGKVIGVYSVMGEYDIVALGEAPNDEAAMSFALALGSQGNIRSTTLKAFSKEAFAAIVRKLPG
jgi:uncharacterized protein with GYD domain